MDNTLTGEEEILLTALSGQEEVFSEHDISALGMQSSKDMPTLFRECDAQGSFESLFAHYDENTSLELEGEEEEKICSERSERKEHHNRRAHHMITLLEYVYDLDKDGVISDEERMELYSDFSARCETIHDQLLSEFDINEDGVLSMEEREAAREEAIRRHQEGDRHADHERGEESRGPRHGRSGLPPFARTYDVNEDGSLDGQELSTFRREMRENITSGEAFARSCGAKE
jgi:Ca2+-binding EF-hand superfamily protein